MERETRFDEHWYGESARRAGQKARRYHEKARRYRDMANALADGDVQEAGRMPKYVPRGHDVPWYDEQADRLDKKGAEASEKARAHRDIHDTLQLARLSPEEREEIQGSQRSARYNRILRIFAEMERREQLSTIRGLMHWMEIRGVPPDDAEPAQFR
jgi:hypothetical protein